MKRKAFSVWITLDDRLDISAVLDRGKVRRFALNYRARIGGAWHAVVRYDTCHGRLHAHRFWLPTGQECRDLEHDRPRRGDYTHAMEAAKIDIDGNWAAYRATMEASLDR